MNIGGINGFDPYSSIYHGYGSTSSADRTADQMRMTPYQKEQAEKIREAVNPKEDEKGPVKNPGASEEKKPGRKSSPAECETCKNRKYQDGSDEMVSFKSAQHVSPGAAGAAVRAHEGEHVSNAYKKAAENNGKVVNASVTIHTSICPECGRSYVSGGVTNTQIRYYNEDNKYQQDLKSKDAAKYVGMNLDIAV